MTTNAVAWNKLQEEKRHNEEMERQGVESQKIARENIQLGYANVGLGYSQLAESTRHNITAEMEAGRHNVTSEIETNRHNEVMEYWTGKNLSYQEEVNTIKGGTYWVNTGIDLAEAVLRSKIGDAMGNAFGDALKNVQFRRSLYGK